MGDTEARRAAAELQTRRGLEDSVRLLDEQLSHATQRAELEAKHRREAERRVAHVEAEMASLRTEMSATFGAIQTGEGDRHDRERAANHRLDAALVAVARVTARVARAVACPGGECRRPARVRTRASTVPGWPVEEHAQVTS